jgi:hypothetical protein
LNATLQLLTPQVSAQAVVSEEADFYTDGPDLINARLRGGRVKLCRRIEGGAWRARSDCLAFEIVKLSWIGRSPSSRRRNRPRVNEQA